MSATEWKPGDVALVTSWRGKKLPAFRTDRDGSDIAWCVLDGTDTRGLAGHEVQEAKRAVLIELPIGALAGWPVLIKHLKIAGVKTGWPDLFGDLIAQIESQTVPKPDEPTGLGAVVEDCDGGHWILCDRRNGVAGWRWVDSLATGRWRKYDDIEAVRVLSEGVPD